ncbi:MAG TPA: hypothetical protein VGP17_12755 [Solirubrobacteraceae bacterium]|jgi:hypothetical protein|nr:hypothetical protein [Solirubrobacteraceae bacterium]
MRRVLLIGGALAAIGLLLLTFGHGGNGAVVAAGADASQPPTSKDFFEPNLGLPATGVVAFGSSPGEAPGEVWAFGELGAAPIQIEGKSYSNQYALLTRSETSPWQVVPLPEPEGKPLAQSGGQSGPGAYGALAGQATDDGGIVLLSGQSIVARNPGAKPVLVSAPQPAPSKPSEGDEHGLAAGESLLPAGSGGSATVPYAAIEEEGDVTGVLIAPYHDGGKASASGAPEAQPGVLHFNGHQEWTREEVQAQGEELEHFTAIAMSCAGTGSDPEASSPENCWLLTGYGAHEVEHLGLFRRMPSGKKAGWSWQPQPVSDWMLGSAALPHGVSQASVSPLPPGAQMLTATAQGAWVDFEVRVNGLATPVYVSEMVLAPEGGTTEQAQVGGTWCYPGGTVCERSLGAPLPARYRSFAWPGTSSSDLGTRVITGLPGRAMLELAGGNFSYMAGAGGEPGLDPGGAAFYHSSLGAEGLVADGVYKENDGPDGEGQAQAVAVTNHEPVDQLHEEPVPFRHPLLAVAQAPGTTPGDPNAEALAVGVDGEVGRYVPGEGWHPEGLYNTEGEALTPVLRGVAWPEPNRAYAVGDNGAMWLWMKETGYWVPDPARPFNFIGNLTAIAFQPGHPQVGYAVGKQGVLLRYGKSWAQISKAETEKLEQELKIEEWRLNFTSIAFAGGEALVTYRDVIEEHGTGQVEAGGLLVNEGAGWHVDPSAASLLSHLPAVRDTVLSKVAGLPDGGAVAAGPNVMMERESPGAPWRMSQTPLPEAKNISALAAYRDADGAVRPIASVDLDRSLDPGLTDGNLTHGPFKGDVPASTGAGQPPPFIPPDPLPDSGYVLEETASGWVDMEHDSLPTRTGAGDMPVRPDPVFALLVEPSGQSGLAVGGQTYDSGGGGPEEKAETSAAMRFPGTEQNDAQESSISAPSGEASFAIGGDADCDEECATLANESIGPDVWLTHALQTANRISGARAFLYTGGRVPVSVVASEGLLGFERELERFRELLDTAGPTMQVYTAASRELEPLGVGGGPFERIVLPHGNGMQMCTEAPTPCEPGTAAYSFTSQGSSGGPVRVIVLDFSSDSLEVPGSSRPHAQEEWLQAELKAAADATQPAIVMGYDSLGFSLPDQSGSVGAQAADAQAVSKILVEGEASAYIFDYPGVNVKTQVTWQGRSIPAYGSGTLGSETPASGARDSLASSAFLLLSINPAKSEPGMPHVAQVSAAAIPNAGQISLDATNGTLLRRSKPALFEALVRRPAAGVVVSGAKTSTQGVLIDPDAYDPIPTDCQGTNCAYEVPIEYTYSSSQPDIGNFVAHESASSSTVQIKLGANGKPIPDSKSGLFCAYNEGTTTVSITAGGLTYSMPVTVQGGSSEQPCGTVPLEHPPVRYETANTPFVVSNAGTPNVAPISAQISNLVPPPAPKLPHQLPPAPLLLTNPAALFAIPPPPLSVATTTPQPTPPSGTAQVPAQSPVAQQVSVAEREEEVEGAYQHVQNMAAYEHPEGESFPTWPIALIVIAAAAGAGLRPRRDRDAPVYAWARGFRKDL